MKLLLTLTLSMTALATATEPNKDELNDLTTNNQGLITTDEIKEKIEDEFNVIRVLLEEVYQCGALGGTQYMWSPSHGTLLFYSNLSGTGADNWTFWAYQKNSSGKWVLTGVYSFVSKIRIWTPQIIDLRDNGFYVEWIDENNTCFDFKYFFDFQKKSDECIIGDGESYLESNP